MILHFSGQLEMKLRQDGAMSDHGIMHGLIQLPFRLKSQRITTSLNLIMMRKLFRICEKYWIIAFLKSNSIQNIIVFIEINLN